MGTRTRKYSFPQIFYPGNPQLGKLVSFPSPYYPMCSTSWLLKWQTIDTPTPDNVSNNHKQACELEELDNSFKYGYHIPCTNHSIQLAVKAFLSPLNPGVGAAATAASDDLLTSEDLKQFEIEEEADDANEGDVTEDNYEGDGVDELEQLTEEEREELLDETLAIREVVSKV